MSKMMTMKRKEVDEVSDDFSDFSLSSPARKIRRLDAELPPIIEEEDAKDIDEEIEMIEEEKKKKQQLQIEELLPTTTSSSSPSEDKDNDNIERAIVLFKPVNSQLLQRYSSPSNFSVSLNPQFISGFKNHFLWSNSSHSGPTNSAQEEATNESMAVVPWVPPQPPFAQPQIEIEAPPPELMDIEDCNSNSLEHADYDFGGMRLTNGLSQPQPQWPQQQQQQQQQQHCMIPHFPEFPHNKPTPVSWFQ